MSDLSTVCERLRDGAAPQALEARPPDLDGHWLELHCCGGTTLLPIRLIRAKRDDSETLTEILVKLHCKLCGGPPRRAWLNETPHREAGKGLEPGWSVQLIPLPFEVEAAE